MNTKLRCLLLDDELPGLAYLRMICEQLPGIEVVRAFNDPLKLMEEANSLDFNMCILDIEMPGMNGMQVAKALKDKAVIFTSAYKEYAAEAFDIDAIDYIRKPIQKERLEKAIQKAQEQLSKDKRDKQYAHFNTNKGKAIVFFNQLVLLTISPTDKRDKLTYLDNGTDIVLKNIPFKQVLEVLPDRDFCRINKKDLVALKSVKFYTHTEVIILLNGKEKRLSLGENFKKEFLTKISF